MKPLRHPLVPDGRGHRTPQTLPFIDERDTLLREAADRFCVGMSDRQAAAMLHAKLARYREGAWRRDRSEALCPPRLAGRIDALMWMVLTVSDRPVMDTYALEKLSGWTPDLSPPPDSPLFRWRVLAMRIELRDVMSS